MKILDAKFVGAFMDPSKCPSDRPGVVFTGRSNVGKSTLLNRVLNRAIARTSKTPGRTRQLVYFAVERAKGKPFYLVDLPGYGYASGPRAELERFGRAARALLADERRVRAVLQLVDASVPWQESDLEMLDWLLAEPVPFALVYTKADRTKRGPLAAKTQELKKLLPWREDATILTTSAKDNEGIVGVRKWVEAVLAPSQREATGGSSNSA
jgi:GTP-binding protein